MRKPFFAFFATPFALVAASALFLVACLDDPVYFSDATPEENAQIAQRIAAVQENLSALRGLTFTRPLHSTIISRDRYVAQTKQALQGIPVEYDRFYSRELAQLGFFPDTTASIAKLYGDFYGAFPAAYYVDGKDSIYVLSEYKNDTAFLQHALPHELTHTLQDQGLNAFDRTLKADAPNYYQSDFGEFRTCLYEGDAEFTSTAYEEKYIRNNPDPFGASLEVGRSRRPKDYARWRAMTPPQTFFAPAGSAYGPGMAMAGEAYAAGSNWKGINDLYARRTGTTRSVMVAGSATSGVPIDYSGVFAQVDTSQAFVDDFAFGSLHMMSLHISNLTQDQFLNGMGWTGDRFLFTRKLGVRYGTLVWTQAFESDSAAQFAYGSLTGLLPTRFQGTTYSSDIQQGVYAGAYDQSLTLNSDGLYTVLIRKGREVWWVEGAGTKTDAVVAALANRAPPVVALAKRGEVTGKVPPFFGPPQGRRYIFPR
jgi:hypothetical protein